MAGVQFSAEAVRRIAVANRNVERTPVDRTSDKSSGFNSWARIWQMLFGTVVGGIRNRFSKVVFEQLSPVPEDFAISNTLRDSFDGNAFGHTAVKVNGGGISPFTLV